MRGWCWVLLAALWACDDGETAATPDRGPQRDAGRDMLPQVDQGLDMAALDEGLSDQALPDMATDATPAPDARIEPDLAVDAAEPDMIVDAAPDMAVDAAPPPVDGCGANPWPELMGVRDGRFIRFNVPGDDLAPRRVSVFVPAGYFEGDQRYPVLYMHDGQNLFDPREASFGQDWAVDDAINALGADIEPVIVVGVDNTADRIAEYTHSVDPEYGGGQGAAYGRFLVERLKPFIDENFRTICDDTGVAGSSLGGLVSMRLWLDYPEVFNRVAAVSPSFWWNDREILGLLDVAWPAGTRMWIDGGGAEGGDADRDGRTSVIENSRAVAEALVAAGAPFPAGLGYREDPTGEHNEPTWRARLPEILTYLYGAPLGDPQAISIRAWSQEMLSDVGFPLSVDARWPGLVLTLPHGTPEWAGVEVVDGAAFSNARGIAITATWRGRMAGYENAVRPSARVEFRVRAPGNPPEQAVHVAGSAVRLGEWDPVGVPLVRDGDVWTVTVPMVAGAPYEYKFNRGDWASVEKGPGGEEVQNRRGVAMDGVVEIAIPRWADSR